MPIPFSISIGQRFTRLIVESFFGSDRHRKRVWKCRCTCGTITYVTACDLRAGKSRSCGCLSVKHGMKGTAEYRAWQAMKDRCYRHRNKAYKNYGGRGISVCDRWRYSFENFIADMGKRPTAKHSLDRKENNGNYEPDNCVWATTTEQIRNRRVTRLLTFRGETMCSAAWADHLGLNRNTLCHRLLAGWPVELALTTPAHHGNTTPN